MLQQLMERIRAQYPNHPKLIGQPAPPPANNPWQAGLVYRPPPAAQPPNNRAFPVPMPARPMPVHQGLPPRWGQRPAPQVSPPPNAERFNQRGRPIPSQANLTGNQLPTWQQRMAGKQGAAVTNGRAMAKPALPTSYAPGQAPQTSPTPGFIPQGR